jgi:hypothetical protein
MAAIAALAHKWIAAALQREIELIIASIGLEVLVQGGILLFRDGPKPSVDCPMIAHGHCKSKKPRPMAGAFCFCRT